MKTVKTIDFITEVIKALEEKGFEYGDIFETLLGYRENNSYVWYSVAENYMFFTTDEKEEEVKYRTMEKAFNDYLLENGCEQGERILILVEW